MNKSEWVTVEERQRHWLIFIPFRFAFWCLVWATILVLAFHPSSEVGAAGTIVLASISTFSAKTKTRRYRVRN